MLSVRIVQPDCPHLPGATLWPGLTCLLDQVSPPSLETETVIGAAPNPVNFA